MVGHSTDAITHDVDARWIMSYAAGIDDRNPRYLDTQANTVVAHPLFPVCLEWPVILSSRHLPGSETMTAAEGARGVHAAHDLHIYRPIRAGERLTTRATVIGLQRIKPGAAQTTRLDTVDEAGELVCRTYQLGISRNVDVIGAATFCESAPEVPRLEDSSGDVRRISIPVPATAAHVYTECARIWNPIHTDRVVALAAGLPDIILHGTATLALSVSRLVAHDLGGAAERVREIQARFTGMVPLPSSFTVRGGPREGAAIAFDAVARDGAPVLSQGVVSV